MLGFGPAQRATAVLQWSAAAQRYTVATPAHQPAANAHHLLHHHLDHYLNWYLYIYIVISFNCLFNIFNLKCVIKDIQIIDCNTNRVTVVIFTASYFKYEYTHILVFISTHASHRAAWSYSRSARRRHKDLMSLGVVLRETYAPLLALGRLPALPQLGLHHVRTLMPTPTFTLLAHSWRKVSFTPTVFIELSCISIEVNFCFSLKILIISTILYGVC